jgi:hypothetical protein
VSDLYKLPRVRLAIADPPYPPSFGERRDLVDGGDRLTKRSRAVRWYGGGAIAADHHPAAADWDSLTEHQKLITHMVRNFDGWALATTPDGLGAYHPLPVSAHVMAWHRPNAMPGGHRLVSRWEPVIVFVPEGRRHRDTGPRVLDFLSASAPRINFAGAKPPEWTSWVLDALGYTDGDEVVDLFPGSGSVSKAIEVRR